VNGEKARLDDVHGVLKNPAPGRDHECVAIVITRKHLSNVFMSVAASVTVSLVVVG